MHRLLTLVLVSLIAIGIVGCSSEAAPATAGSGDNGGTDAHGLASQACDELGARWAASEEERNDGFYERASRYADAAAAEDPSAYTELAADITSLVDSWEHFRVGLDEANTIKMRHGLDDVGSFNESLSATCGQIGVEVPARG